MTFTVVILDPRGYDFLGRDSVLFAVAQAQGDVALCQWNQAGTSLANALPDLGALIADQQDWRAIVVWLPETSTTTTGCPITDQPNPFDFDPKALDPSPPAESREALVRLSHMLGGFPFIEPMRFQRTEPTAKERAAIPPRLLEPHYMPVEWPEADKERQAYLVERYRLHFKEPSEVILVSPKIIDESSDDPTPTSTTIIQENQASTFWRRNNYPSLCRFITAKVYHPSHVRYEASLFDFWLGVLTLATNDIPASALQGYRLYEMETIVDKDKLADSISYVINRETVAQKSLTAALAATEDVTIPLNEDVLTGEDVPLTFGEITDAPSAETDHFGLAIDCRHDDPVFTEDPPAWFDTVNQIAHYLKFFLRAPQRTLQAAAAQVRDRAEAFAGKPQVLDQWQLKDLDEAIDALGWQAVTPARAYLLDFDAARDRLEPRDTAVQGRINVRIPRHTATVLGTAALAFALLAFLPFWLFTGIRSAGTVPVAILLSLVAVAVIASGGLAVLRLLQGNIFKAIKGFNLELWQFCREVVASAADFEAYLSNLLTLMKAHSIKLGAQSHESFVSARKMNLRNHQTWLTQVPEHMRLLATSFGITPQARVLEDDDLLFDFTVEPVASDLYRFPLDNVPQKVPLGAGGDQVVAPYPFLARLNLQRVELYETDEPKKTDKLTTPPPSDGTSKPKQPARARTSARPKPKGA